MEYKKPVFFLLLFIAFIAGFAVLKTASSFLLPVLISILVSFIFYPLV